MSPKKEPKENMRNANIMHMKAPKLSLEIEFSKKNVPTIQLKNNKVTKSIKLKKSTSKDEKNHPNDDEIDFGNHKCDKIDHSQCKLVAA